MASTTTAPTVVWLADWTNAASAHGPTLAMWLREELGDTSPDTISSAFSRWLRRIDDPGCWADFWTADRHITRLGLHPAMAPMGTWSHMRPTHSEEARRKDREAKARKKAAAAVA